MFPRGGEKDTRLGRESHNRDPSLQKEFSIDFQRGAGHGQLKYGDNKLE